MIKAALEYLNKLATPQTYEINGDTYATVGMSRVAPHIDRPDEIKFHSLDSITQAIKTEIDREEIPKPLFVSVNRHDLVEVFTTYRTDNMKRDSLYEARPELPDHFPTWSEHDDAIIMLRSRFIQNAGTEYLLELLSRVSNEDTVSSEDNGVTQKVTATKGIAMKQIYDVNGRVTLAPFRTFLEVAQPESEFILRVKQGDKEKDVPMKIGIIEADGGAWKLKAKHNIADYFRESLKDLISENLVVVAE